MDYIDYKVFMKRSWEKNHKSHQDRIKEILAVPSTRIDNKPSELHQKAPCRKKPKKFDRSKAQADLILVNTLKEIHERDYLIELKDRISEFKSLKNLPRKFKPLVSSRDTIEGNIMIQGKLNRVKSNFSKKDWDKQYKEAKVYSKMISKPHLSKKLPSINSNTPQSKRQLLESYSTSLRDLHSL